MLAHRSEKKRRDHLCCVVEMGGRQDVHLADGPDDKVALHISSTWDIPYTPDYTEHWKLRTSELEYHRSQLAVMFHVARNCGHHGWSERTAVTAMCAGLVQSQNYAGGCQRLQVPVRCSRAQPVNYVS